MSRSAIGLLARGGSRRGFLPAQWASRLAAAVPYLTTAVVLLLIYGKTLLPGIGNSGDTIKFDFLG